MPVHREELALYVSPLKMPPRYDYLRIYPLSYFLQYYHVINIVCAIKITGVLSIFMCAFCHYRWCIAHMHVGVLLLRFDLCPCHLHHWRSALARLLHYPQYLRVVPFHMCVSLPCIESSTRHYHHWCDIALRLLRHNYQPQIISSPFLNSFFWIQGNLA